MDIKIFATTFLITWYIVHIIVFYLIALEKKEKILFIVSMIVVLLISLFLIWKVV